MVTLVGGEDHHPKMTSRGSTSGGLAAMVELQAGQMVSVGPSKNRNMIIDEVEAEALKRTV
jgi:hypothetical protein